MGRSLHPILFILLASLLWTMAYAVQQDAPPCPGREGQEPPPAGESPHYFIDKNNELLKLLPPAAEPPAGETTPGDGIGEQSAGPESGSGEQTVPPERPVAAESPPPPRQPCPPAEAVHFLLIGRWRQSPSARMLMTVTLVPENCALLTAIDPAVEVVREGQRCPVGALLTRDDGRAQLYGAMEELSGLRPQFCIELNLEGFIEMVDLLWEEGPQTVSAVHREDDRPPRESGAELLALLCDFQSQDAVKEARLVDCLLRACAIRTTRLGLKLLWMGYHNLSTDLSLGDLIQLRKISEQISPLEVSLTTISR